MVRQNAANDIFERVNSQNGMGVITDEDQTVTIDLHGLHVDEAKLKLTELIFPVIEVFNKVALITGYGLHSKTGDSVLKTSLKSFLQEKKFKFNED